MASMRTVILLALSAVALAQLQVVVETEAPTAAAAPIVVPPTDVLCPSMSALGPGTYLSTEPWSLGRVVHVMQKSTIVGTPDTELGTITSVLWSLKGEYELKDPINHKLIAKFVNPSFFWDTKQEIYDCKGTQTGTVAFAFNFLDFLKRTFTRAGAYHTHQVFNNLGQHVATLSQEELTTEKGGFLGSRQHYLYLKDNLGSPLAAMRQPFGGWQFGPFGEHLGVQVEMLSENPVAPKPSMDPEFLSLVFANGLATGTRVSPGVGTIIDALLVVALLGYLLSCCCGAKKSKEMPAKLEEKEGLLATRVNGDSSAEAEVKAKGRDIWACCSRRGGEAEKKVGAVAPK